MQSSSISNSENSRPGHYRNDTGTDGHQNTRLPPDTLRRDHRHAALHVAGTNPSTDGDARSKIFSLGAALYEMATGSRAFPAHTAHEIVAGILNEEPPWPRRLRGGTPWVYRNVLDAGPTNRLWLPGERRVRYLDHARRWPGRIQLTRAAGLNAQPGALPDGRFDRINVPSQIGQASYLDHGYVWRRASTLPYPESACDVQRNLTLVMLSEREIYPRRSPAFASAYTHCVPLLQRL
jgi:hypothetical protein